MQLHPLLSLHPQLLPDNRPEPLHPHPPPQKSSRRMIHTQLSPPKPQPQLLRVLLHPQFVADKSLMLSASKLIFMVYDM